MSPTNVPTFGQGQPTPLPSRAPTNAPSFIPTLAPTIASYSFDIVFLLSGIFYSLKAPKLYLRLLLLYYNSFNLKYLMLRI
jgi:hypothetical protein